MTTLTSRLAEDQPPDQPRADGSVHDTQHCYECGASSRDVHMHSIIRYSRETQRTEYRWACAEIGECSMRRVQRLQAGAS